MSKKFFFAILSSGRPNSVPKMAQHFEKPGKVHWFVPPEQKSEYEATGATNITTIHSPGNVIPIRNLILDSAEGKITVMLDDDLRRIAFTVGKDVALNKDAVVTDISLETAAQYIWNVMQDCGARMGGGAPTWNKYFYREGKIKHAALINGMMIMAPNEPLRFDTNFIIREDYDYSLQHIQKYGRVARAELVLPNFDYGSLKGGWQGIRTDEMKEKSYWDLVGKWGPHIIQRQTKRPNEIRVNWRKAKAELAPVG